MKTLLILTFFTFLLKADGCGETDPDPVVQEPVAVDPLPNDRDKPAGKSDSIVQIQKIDSLSVIILESFPVQAQVILYGNYSDGCTRFHHAETSKTGNEFSVQLYNIRPKDAFCTEALVPFTVPVRLDVYGLPKGTYKVRSGNASTSFILSTDNRLPEK